MTFRCLKADVWTSRATLSATRSSMSSETGPWSCITYTFCTGVRARAEEQSTCKGLVRPLEDHFFLHQMSSLRDVRRFSREELWPYKRIRRATLPSPSFATTLFRCENISIQLHSSFRIRLFMYVSHICIRVYAKKSLKQTP